MAATIEKYQKDPATGRLVRFREGDKELSSSSGKGNRRYVVRYREPGGGSRQETFVTLDAATARRDEITSELHTGDYQDKRQGKMTLQELYDEVHATRPFAPKTRQIHDTAWTHVPDGLRRTSISEIDAAAIDRVLSQVKAPAMREKLRSVLSALFSWAIEKRRLKVNPAKKSGIRLTRSEKIETAPRVTSEALLSSRELALLVAQLPDRDKALVRLMAHVGLRPGEAYALTVGQHLSLERKLVIDRSSTGPTKTGETRVIPLPAVVSDMLTEHIARYSDPKDPTAPVFTTDSGAQVDGHNWRARVFVPAVKSAGVKKNLRVVDLRHTAAAFAIGHGANVYAVQRMLGHAKPSLTLDTYGFLWDKTADELAERLDVAIRAEWVDAKPAEVVPIGG